MPELTPEQKMELRRWERQMKLTFVVAWVVFFLFVGFDLLVQDVPLLVYFYLVGVALAVLWGAYVRTSQRCPRCGSRIGSWFGLLAYFGLPPNCKQCGVSFQ